MLPRPRSQGLIPGFGNEVDVTPSTFDTAFIASVKKIKTIETIKFPFLGFSSVP